MFDLSDAFDMIDHGIMLCQLFDRFGIDSLIFIGP